MNMSLSKRDRDILIGFFGVLIAVAVWFLVASPNIEKKEALKAENVTLSAKAAEYEAVNARVDEYSEGIINNQIEIDKIVDHYPGEIRTEDELMFWANIANAYPLQLAFGDLALEERDAVTVTGVTDTGNAEVTYDEDGNPVFQDSQASELTAQYLLYGAPMGMAFSSTYGGLKNMISYITGQYDRNTILGIDVSYDESDGVLAGTIAMELYYIDGLEKEYKPVFIPSVPTGQLDIFHTGLSSLLDAVAENLETAQTSDEVTED